MFRNYLNTALRNIARHRLYSFINIAGLAVGLACVIFVLLFIRDELSYDAWAPGTQNLYRIEKTATAISIGVRENKLVESLGYIDRSWRAFAPANAIQRRILSQDFVSLFDSIERQEVIFSVFVGMAIGIASLGLFGLAALAAERRTREIGIRKIFGASVSDIVLLLLGQFSVPVLAANVIAWPVAYYFLRRWLDGYPHRISLSLLYFVLAGLIALLIAWATIFAHALRVALANPINALRYE